ncbi:MAG: twin-arginine translocation signal domain-containing protein [Thaumarchaeota archaeon]|nr:twin-arginine translocation signal domain-containing protein [Nitrososphaerota archaeon]MBI3022329.1 twin-arginine translocation signal domain-containing protein [Nitrososphaerota archaeon]MBI3116912.1 twin-arginine translocation signal domain-containing protein [Nitrososphaerota archaeon]
MSSKLNRRDAIKALAVAGAVIAAAPYMANVSGATQSTPAGLKKTTFRTDTKGPLVIVVTERMMMGFRGDEEFSIDDVDLASQLNRAFAGSGVE